MKIGCVYEISEDINEIGMFDEERITKNLARYADQVRKTDKKTQKDLCLALLTRMAECGAKIGFEDMVPWFTINDEAKKIYFAPMYTETKRVVEDFTLDDFISLGRSRHLAETIRNTLGDYVSPFPGIAEPLDDFIREAESETKYYLGDTAIIHLEV